MKLSKLENKRIFDFVITRPGVLDKENDVVPQAEIGEALDGWLIRDAPISDLHTNRIIGKGLRWYQAADGRIIARGIIHDDSRVSDEVWKKIVDGEYASVSIGGAAFEKTPNGQGGSNLNGLEIMEVAVCPKGMHQDANILDKNDLAKSFVLKADISALKKEEVVEEKKAGNWDTRYSMLNAKGKARLDEYSRRIYGKYFLDLDSEDQGRAIEQAGGLWYLEEEYAKVLDKDYASFLTKMVGEEFTESEIIAFLQSKGVSDFNVVKEIVSDKVNLTSVTSNGGITMSEMKKEEVPSPAPSAPGGNSLEAIMQAIQQLQAEIAQLKQMATPAPAPTPVAQASPIEPVKDVEIQANKAVEVAVVKSTTPLPPIETGVQKKAVEFPALKIARGEAKLDDFIKSNEIAKLEKTLAMKKEFDAYKKAKGGM